MALNKILVWPDSSWVFENGWSQKVHGHLGEYIIAEVDNKLRQDEIDLLVMYYAKSGSTDVFQATVQQHNITLALDFLAESDHVKVVINPTGDTVCEVYALQGQGYKSHIMKSGLSSEHKLEIEAYVACLNVQIKHKGFDNE